jgi:glycosyltransferase involved in cell wall biosynthesis
MKFFVVSPALNEDRTIAATVTAAKSAPSVEEVVVVDNGSSDKTALYAAGAGAIVVSYPDEVGKAQAVRRGLEEVLKRAACSPDEIGIVLLDADLSGLTPNHVEALIAPLQTQETQMVCGYIESPTLKMLFRWTAAKLPFSLTGQRAIPSMVLQSVDWTRCKGYFLEHYLNRAVSPSQTSRVTLAGVSHTRREKKPTREWARGSRLPHFLVGPSIRSGVLLSYLWFYVRSASRIHDESRWIGANSSGCIAPKSRRGRDLVHPVLTHPDLGARPLPHG